MVSGMPGQSETETTENVATGITMDAQELLALGKRHMILDEYSTAVEYFANACQQLASQHGDLDKQCAPAYLLYGRCLLELARQNMGIVEPESAKAKGEEKKDEAGASGEKMADIAEGEEDEEENGDDGDDEGESEENGADNEEKPSSTDAAENGDGEEEENEEEEEEEDEADSYLKLAWTFLDLAKVIFLKETTSEGDFAAADCLMALGEVSMEGGNCDAGVKDMQEAIRLRRLHSGRVDRIVAGSEYELGAALHQFQRYDEALVSLKECLSILSELNEKVAEKLKTVTDKEEEDNLQSSAKEFSELINDVKDKIAEVEEERSMREMVSKELAEKLKESGAEVTEAPIPTAVPVSTNGEVKTLTARRKQTSDGAAPSPARTAAALVSSLAAENIAADSPAAKSRVAALISAQLKRHRLDSPGATNGNGDSQPVKRPASSNSTENDARTDVDDEVTSKRIRADESDAAAANNN